MLASGYDSNQKWFTDMVNACMGTSDVTCGILSSPDEWKYTLGKFFHMIAVPTAPVKLFLYHVLQ
jgi:hypothetical protein